MEENLPVYQVLNETPKVLPMIYQDCAQPSVQKVGKALETVFDFCNTILLPLKLINEKARLNFQKHMSKYEEKLNKIEPEKIIDVSSMIGTPIIDRLTYVTNDEIADLFINLLTKASSIDTLNTAHPTFIHIIDRLTVDECRLIKHFENKGFIPYINVHLYDKNNSMSYQKLAWNLTGLEFDVDLLVKENIDTYLDNLASLKIIEAQGAVFKADETIYKELEDKYKALLKELDEYAITLEDKEDTCQIKRGFFEITDLGKSFIKACNNK